MIFLHIFAKKMDLCIFKESAIKSKNKCFEMCTIIHIEHKFMFS